MSHEARHGRRPEARGMRPDARHDVYGKAGQGCEARREARREQRLEVRYGVRSEASLGMRPSKAR
eukprot:2469465-Alexandrium_andersonii.AAC.1